ncbi:MAG TPA: type II toxin-antitoxin system antitoxin SocA domain-containing protein [Chitinophaga sp.]|uniref:Panacea domain-containing protein n=1 Tax=Chitinophaga sp. TaxID=1869181 RepID=UPI002DBEAA3F|nr:type II toxin-antitoxin system antitoxin SocA domain-containing protein [Chitinophaga sp.]HEU4554556.1 type II toxin-antitoxin system antitoxin SocA domain-containing protein [Chitinophaga sp.]
MLMRGFNYKKAVQALNFLAEKNGSPLNKMKAIKLIWLADRLHLRTYGRTITGDVYFALPYGPVPSTTRDILEINSFSLSDDELNYSNEYLVITDKLNYNTNKVPNTKVFSKTDLDILEKILEKYGAFDQFTLSKLSHQFPEWKKYESALKQKVASRFEMNYIDFFEDVDDSTKLFIADPSSTQLAKDIYLEDQKMSNIL